MQILPATFLDLNALMKLERACFGADVWPLLDLIAVLTLANVVRLKAVESGDMIGSRPGIRGLLRDSHGSPQSIADKVVEPTQHDSKLETFGQ